MLKQIVMAILAAAVLVSCNPRRDRSAETKESAGMKIDDKHSYANPDEALVKHLDWEATVDFDQKNIRGIARLTIETAEDASELILDTKNLTIEKVTLGEEEKPARYEVGEFDENLGSPLSVSITPQTKTVNVYYASGENAEALQWLAPEQTAGGKHPFLFTQSQSIYARTWIPIQDSPGIRFTYTANVKVPPSLLALMSAENPQKKNETGKYSFTMEQPIPAYLLALAVGDIVFEPLGKRTGVYAAPSVIEEAVYEFADLEEMLAVAERLYGPYRWERYDVLVLPPSFPFGGMENPRLTFATPTILAGDRSLVSLIAHELAHSWSGNLVTNATWEDFWLNEGFTVYFENRIMEAMNGRDYSEMLAALSKQELKETVKGLKERGQYGDTKLKTDLDGRHPDDAFSSIPYEKGYFFLRSLEEKIGREDFDIFLKEYFNENAFASMTTENFIRYMNRHLFEANGLDADSSFYTRWIYTEGIPEEIPEVRATRFAEVDTALEKWLHGTPAAELNTREWSTHEWLHFIGQLPGELSTAQMKELDKAFNFTDSGNAEILAAWFVHAIRNDYEPAFQSMEDFLVRVGRRKFLEPLYREMAKTAEGKDMALQIYKKARPNYHYVSTNTIDGILEYDAG